MAEYRRERLPGWRTRVTLCSGKICTKFDIDHIVGVATFGPVTSDKSDEIARRFLEAKRQIARAYKEGYV